MTRYTMVLIAAWLALAPLRLAQAACLVGSDCSDGNLCTGTETCVGGVCQRGPSLNCNDQNPCTVDDCDPLIGCIHATVANGTSCSDGVFCNGAETCTNGTCSGQPFPNGTQCDDGNTCTGSDTCQAGACTGVTRPDGLQCSDGNACNGLELCFSGTCTPGQPKANGTTCSDGNPCNGAETCQSATCIPGTPQPDGALCSDGSVCNGTETCKNHLCTVGVPPPNGTSCSDGNLCNGSETCQNQTCTSSASLNCNDGNPCTSDSCNATLGCQHNNRNNGTSCADLNPCNGVERCQSGQCTPGVPEVDGMPCIDANPCNGFEVCQNAACTPGTPLANGTSCPDGNPCNGEEACQNGACVSPGAPNCFDANPCTLDSCHPLLGCQHLLRENGASCDDDDVCNGLAVCAGGQCTAGAPLVCADADPLTLDGCDPSNGCTRDRPMAGAHLNVRYSGFSRWAIRLVTGDEGLTIGPGVIANGSDADPVLHGATLRLVSQTVGDDFDARYTLTAPGWSYVGAPGENKGYKYRDRLPSAGIRMVKVRTGRPWKLAGRVWMVGPQFGVDPQPVSAHLTFSNERYCMSFGGTISYSAGTQFRATKALRPATCEP